MPFGDWPEPVVWLAAALSALLLIDAARRAGWRAPRNDQLFWATAVALVWSARQMIVTLPGGLNLQYLGAAWLTLLLGYPRAVVSMAAIIAIEALVSRVGMPRFALPFLFLAVAPAWLMWLIARACRRWLPGNLFVFLLGTSFVGLLLAYALPLVLAASLTSWLVNSNAPDYWQSMLPYALLLAGGESWLEGMLITLLVVSVPDNVQLFDQKYYLRRR